MSHLYYYQQLQNRLNALFLTLTLMPDKKTARREKIQLELLKRKIDAAYQQSDLSKLKAYSIAIEKTENKMIAQIKSIQLDVPTKSRA